MAKSIRKLPAQVNTGKKVVAVWGTPGAGKSSFAAQLGVLLAENPKLKVLVADFNTIAPTLDHYLGISKEPRNIEYKINEKDDQSSNTSLGYIYDAIERGIFEPHILEEVTAACPKHKNLHILTGNYLLNLFERLTEKHFDTIIDIARKVYDIVILDTNSVVFVDATYSALKYADRVYALAEGDYTSLRELNREISYIGPYLDKDKIEVVINKYTKKHLDKTTINQVLEGIKVSNMIEYNEKYITSKINKKPFILSCSSKEKQPYVDIAAKIAVGK